MTHLRLCLPNGLRPRLSTPTPHAPHISTTCTQYPVRLILDLITLLCGKEKKIIKVRIMQFSTSSRYFTHFRCKYSPRHPILETPRGSTYFPHVAGHVSRPRKTRHRIMVLTIWIFTFTHADSRRKNKRLMIHWNLFCSRLRECNDLRVPFPNTWICHVFKILTAYLYAANFVLYSVLEGRNICLILCAFPSKPRPY